MVVNLFALRVTDPRELARHPDPVGEANGMFITEAARDATVAVAAWGAHPAAGHRGAVVATGVPDLRCLGVTKAGHPRHPLYVRASQRLERYEPPAVAR